MNIIVKMGQNKEKIKEFLNVLTSYTNAKWRGDEFTPEGYLPNEEDQFEVDIALGLLNAYYFIIDNDTLCWDTEDVIHCVPTDKFDIYDDIDEAIKDIKKDKINIRKVVIKAIDDKHGNVLIDFLKEFTNVTWHNGDKLKDSEEYEDELGFEILRNVEGFKYLIFIIEDNKMSWDTDVYEDELKDVYENSTWYDSVSEFLKSFSK